VLLGWVVHRFVVPLPLRPSGGSDWLEVMGAVLLGSGVLFAWWGALTFLRAHTAIIPHRPATQLVSHGPYRFTRNPMYLGLTVAYVGLAVLMNSAWVLILLPMVHWSLWLLVVRREERYLLAEFGEEYADYCRRVKRFI
jgi:protein-S-isoprenylcysteine O-methyltransferase Ste14